MGKSRDMGKGLSSYVDKQQRLRPDCTQVQSGPSLCCLSTQGNQTIYDKSYWVCKATQSAWVFTVFTVLPLPSLQSRSASSDESLLCHGFCLAVQLITLVLTEVRTSFLRKMTNWSVSAQGLLLIPLSRSEFSCVHIWKESSFIPYMAVQTFRLACYKSKAVGPWTWKLVSDVYWTDGNSNYCLYYKKLMNYSELFLQSSWPTSEVFKFGFCFSSRTVPEHWVAQFFIHTLHKHN